MCTHMSVWGLASFGSPSARLLCGFPGSRQSQVTNSGPKGGGSGCVSWAGEWSSPGGPGRQALAAPPALFRGPHGRAQTLGAQGDHIQILPLYPLVFLRCALCVCVVGCVSLLPETVHSCLPAWSEPRWMPGHPIILLCLLQCPAEEHAAQQEAGYAQPGTYHSPRDPPLSRPQSPTFCGLLRLGAQIQGLLPQPGVLGPSPTPGFLPAFPCP